MLKQTINRPPPGERNAYDDQHLDHDDRGHGFRLGWFRHRAAHRYPKGVRQEQGRLRFLRQRGLGFKEARA